MVRDGRVPARSVARKLATNGARRFFDDLFRFGSGKIAKLRNVEQEVRRLFDHDRIRELRAQIAALVVPNVNPDPPRRQIERVETRVPARVRRRLAH